MVMRTIGLLFCLGIAVMVQADPITLQQAEEQALKHNLVILAQRYDIDAADADVVTAHLFPNNPNISVSGDITPDAGRWAPDKKNYNASLTFPIELGGKKSGRVAVAENEKLATEQGFEDAVRNLLLTVRSEFYDVLNAKASLELALSNESSLDSIVSLNKIRLQDNDIAESELTRSEILAMQQHLEVKEAQMNLHSATANLRLALGVPPTDDNFDVRGDIAILPDSLNQSLDQLQHVAMDHRADLRSLHAQLDEAIANKDLQDAMSVIDLSVGGYYSEQLGQSFTGLTLSVPLPLFNRNQGEIQKAEIRVNQLKTQIDALEHQINTDVETAYNEVQTRRTIVEQIQHDVLARSQSLKETVAYSYRRGGTSILDFLDAERTFNDTMKSYYDSLTALHKSSFALRAATGQ